MTREPAWNPMHAEGTGNSEWPPGTPGRKSPWKTQLWDGTPALGGTGRRGSTRWVWLLILAGPRVEETDDRRCPPSGSWVHLLCQQCWDRTDPGTPCFQPLTTRHGLSRRDSRNLLRDQLTPRYFSTRAPRCRTLELPKSSALSHRGGGCGHRLAPASAASTPTSPWASVSMGTA